MRRRCLAACLLTLSGLTPTPASPLPEIGDVASATMSLKDEARLGESFMLGIRRSLTLVDDPIIVDYIDDLGQRLARHAGSPGRRFSFFVVDDPSINAFAGPGGYIGVHSGLILTTQSEAELAAVLAHEIAHVTQRHLARAYEAIGASSLPMTAAVIASIIIGSHDSQAGSAALASIAAGSAQRQINFTRSNEQEADRIGLDILARSGFDPRAMPAFFRRLRQSTRLLDDQGLEFLRTHPVTNTRIADTEGRAEQYPRVEGGEALDFRLIQARTRVLAGQDGHADIDYFRARIDQGGDKVRAANRYGYALALSESRQTDEAGKSLAPLVDRYPDDTIVRLLEARIDATLGKTTEAVAILTTLYRRHPGNWAVVSRLARLHLDDGHPHRARELIRDFMEGRDQRRVPLVFRLRAEIENALGNTARSHRFLAEYYARLGETRAAIRQLLIALKVLETRPDARLGEQIRERLKTLERRLEDEGRS